MWHKKFPQKANTASFVETLYALANRSGLQNVEITTMVSNASTQQRKNASGKDPSKLLRPYQVRISGEGRYRTIAQYLGSVHDIERYSNTTSLEMKPDKHTIRTNIIFEIISFEGQDAS